ncbi:hypothetical protein SESBI_31037 [Sesbania bispinosa]|nr:hypothetical protein SESBI_31037 [Sesbania bispinosa]
MEVSSEGGGVAQEQKKSLFTTTTEMALDRKVVSYKDAILGASDEDKEESSGPEDDSSASFESSSEDEAMESDEEVGERGKIRVLGKKVGLRFLHLRLLKLWKVFGEMELIDLEFDYFLVRFSNASDFDMVFQSRPWMIAGHYLVIQKWQPNFFPAEDELRRVAVWVRIPSLPMEYYNREILGRIGDVLGKTIRADSNTLKPRDVKVDDQQQGGQGTMQEGMKDDKVQDCTMGRTEKYDGDFGPWMIVQKQTRKRQIANRKETTGTSKSVGGTNLEIRNQVPDAHHPYVEQTKCKDRSIEKDQEQRGPTTVIHQKEKARKGTQPLGPKTVQPIYSSPKSDEHIASDWPNFVEKGEQKSMDLEGSSSHVSNALTTETERGTTNNQMSLLEGKLVVSNRRPPDVSTPGDIDQVMSEVGAVCMRNGHDVADHS